MTIEVALLSIGLGLLGFVEPCSMGSNLVLVKHLGQRPYRSTLLQIAVYTVVRALFMGVLGATAALIGGYFFDLQRALWIGLGAVYLAFGLLYLCGRQDWLVARLGSLLPRASGARGSAALGLLFGLNVPACAVPLIAVLLGLSASQAAAGDAPLQGFISLLLFGLALSVPLVLAVLWSPARRGMDWLAGLSVRLPRWTGAVLAALGAVAHLARWLLWKPWKTLRVPLVWVLHVAYAWIPVHLALRCLSEMGWIGTSPAEHALMVGAAGGLIIGMMTRTSRGHTARPLKADRWDTACYLLVIGAAMVRVLAPLIAPQTLVSAVLVSAALWSAGFGLFAVRYWPVLTRPRLDGKPG